MIEPESRPAQPERLPPTSSAAQEAPRESVEVGRRGEEPFQFTIWDLLAFLRRAFLWMLIPALLFGGFTAVDRLLLTEEVYRARATVILQQERNRNPDELVLPIEGYMQAVHSTRLLRTVWRRLKEDGVEEPRESISSGQLKSRIIRPDRWEAGNVLLMELEARASEAELAARAANHWAEAFIAFDDRLSQVSALNRVEAELDESYDRILERQVVLRQELSTLEEQREIIPPFYELRTTVSDRELAQGAAMAPLISQHPNPLWGKLTERIVENQMELTKLESQRINTARDLAVLRRERGAVRGDRASPLAEVPEVAAEELQPIDETFPASGEQDFALSDVESAGLRVRRALAARGSSRLLDVAQTPVRPEPRGALLPILAAAMGGALLGLLAAVGREAYRAF